MIGPTRAGSYAQVYPTHRFVFVAEPIIQAAAEDFSGQLFGATPGPSLYRERSSISSSSQPNEQPSLGYDVRLVSSEAREEYGLMFRLWRLTIAALLLMPIESGARDDGRYANSSLKPWFESLRSKRGEQCCSDADGRALADVDWETKDGHYRVRIEGEWIDVPDETVITEPNRFGRTILWPFYLDGHPTVRCFMPGSMS